MTRRKFTIADGMILVAALAVGLGLARVHLAQYYRWAMFQSPYDSVQSRGFSQLPIRPQLTAAVPVLAVGSLAVLLLHGLKPRISRRRMVRTPGSAACLAVVFGLVCCLAMIGRWMIGNFTGSNSTGPSIEFALYRFDDWIIKLIGTSIGVSWAALGFGGRWTWRESDWRGQLGQILGWAWLLLFALLEFDLRIIRQY